MLPSEHGSWSFVLEPPLLGMVMAFSWQGLAVVFSALAGFLAYRPLKLSARDLFARKTYPRTTLAVLSGSILALIAAALAVWSGWGHSWRYAALCAASLALGGLFAVVDLRTRPGSLAREMLGALITVPLALAAFRCGTLSQPLLIDAVRHDQTPLARPSDAMFAGLALLCLAKSMPTIAYVRARLRLIARRAQGPSKEDDARSLRAAVWLAAVLAVASFGIALLVWRFIWPTPVPVAPLVMAVLAARVFLGLSPFSLTVKPMVLGLQEFAYSLFFIACVGLSYPQFATFEIHIR